MSAPKQVPEPLQGKALRPRTDTPVFGEQLGLFDAKAYEDPTPPTRYLPKPKMKQPELLQTGDYVLLRLSAIPDYGMVTAVLLSGGRSGELVYRVRGMYSVGEATYCRDDLVLAEAPESHRESLTELAKKLTMPRRPRVNPRPPVIKTDAQNPLYD